MKPSQPKVPLSSPFSHRELNGEIMLEELGRLREGQVRQRHLNDCATELRGLVGMRPSEAISRLNELAGGRFQSQPALASLLARWADRVKTEADVAELVSHFRRLALAGALISAMRRGTERMMDGSGA